jgi:hypothetical protein
MSLFQTLARLSLGQYNEHHRHRLIEFDAMLIMRKKQKVLLMAANLPPSNTLIILDSGM